jgi:hypothetical protein
VFLTVGLPESDIAVVTIQPYISGSFAGCKNIKKACPVTGQAGKIKTPTF